MCDYIRPAILGTRSPAAAEMACVGGHGILSKSCSYLANLRQHHKSLTMPNIKSLKAIFFSQAVRLSLASVWFYVIGFQNYRVFVNVK